jgi:hypothetical protein
MRDIGDVRIAIEHIIAHPEVETPKVQPIAAPAQPRWLRLVPWFAAVALGIVVVMAWAPWRVMPRPQASQSVSKSTEDVPVGDVPVPGSTGSDPIAPTLLEITILSLFTRSSYR